jgi:hypothetical protein
MPLPNLDFPLKINHFWPFRGGNVLNFPVQNQPGDESVLYLPVSPKQLMR